MVLSFIVQAMTPVVRLMALLMASETYYQDELGIYHLQLELAVNDLIEVETDFLTYEKEGVEFEIHIVNGKLISQAGTLDFIHGIDDVWFEIYDDIVYLTYERGDVLFEWPLAYFKE